MEKPNEINYVCARWRDCTTDPPKDGITVPVRSRISGLVNAKVVSEVAFGKKTRPWRQTRYNDAVSMEPGDQWLDVTDEPAIPRAAVQAAVDEMMGVIDAPSGIASEDEFNNGVYAALRILEQHTGVTPTEEES